jgi:hypothetical protein
LRDRFDGSLALFRQRFAERDRFDYGSFGALLEVLACAAAYSPDPDRPGEAQLPFHPVTGMIVERVWERWLQHDPVRMIPAAAGVLRQLRHLHVEAGRSDEANLDLGAAALSGQLKAIGADHSFELVSGGHGGQAHRYPLTIAALIESLAK